MSEVQIQDSSRVRLLHPDILRILAIYLVAFNHTGDQGYTLFVDKLGTAMYFPYLAFSVLCKMLFRYFL